MAEQERRKYPRRSFKKIVGVLSRGEYFLCEGVELGEGGLMFSTELELDIESSLVVNFKVPNHGFIVIHAEIRNHNKKEDFMRYGIEFKDLSFENRRRIRDYIAAKTERESEVEFERKKIEKLSNRRKA